MRVIKVLFYCAILFFILTTYRQIFVHTFLHYDEVGNYLPAWNRVHHKQYAFTIQNPDSFNQTSAFITIGAYVGYSLTLFTSWIGAEWHLARLWINLHAVLLLIIIFFIVKNHFSKPIALLTCTFLMLNSLFIVYSTRIMGEIPALMACFLGFWAYWQGKKKKQTFWYILALIGFELSIFSKEYFAVLIGSTLFLTWVFQEKCHLNATFWIGFTLPLWIIMWYFFHFKNWETVQMYFKERQIYSIEFFAFKYNALQWIIFKPLIWVGYILHSIKCYVQKRPIDLFLWIFQSVYLILFLISIGFERFGMGLCIISTIYLIEFAYGIHYIPAIKKTHKIIISIVLGILIIQKSPYLLWKKSELMPNLDVHFYKNQIIHTPELSLVPLIVKYSYQIPLYPPAKIKHSNYDKDIIAILENQYIKADVLILGEYALTEYSNVYKKIIQNNFEKVHQYKTYEIWVKQLAKKTL